MKGGPSQICTERKVTLTTDAGVVKSVQTFFVAACVRDPSEEEREEEERMDREEREEREEEEKREGMKGNCMHYTAYIKLFFSLCRFLSCLPRGR